MVEAGITDGENQKQGCTGGRKLTVVDGEKNYRKGDVGGYLQAVGATISGEVATVIAVSVGEIRESRGWRSPRNRTVNRRLRGFELA